MSAAAGSRPGRTRATDARIEAAVMHLLREGGPDAVTMESVAATAPVSKVTLYTRYPDRQAMLEGVAERISHPDVHGAVARPLTCGANLEANLSALHVAFTTHAGPKFVAQLLTGDEGFLQVWREQLVAPGIKALRGHFEEAARAGYIRNSIDYGTVVEMILGSMAVSATLQPSEQDLWPSRVASTVWEVITQQDSS